MVKKNYLGFLVDLMAVVKYTFVNFPDYITVMKSEPFDMWEINVSRAVTAALGCEAGIPDLGIVGVWLGGGKKGYCWYLPKRFWGEKFRDEDILALKKLQEMLNMEGPLYFTHHDQPEPDYMKKMDMSGAEQYIVVDVMKAFYLDGKGIIDRVLCGVDPGVAMDIPQ